MEENLGRLLADATTDEAIVFLAIAAAISGRDIEIEGNHSNAAFKRAIKLLRKRQLATPEDGRLSENAILHVRRAWLRKPPYNR